MKRLSGEYPVSVLCRVLGVARSSACYASRKKPARDLERLKAAIVVFRVTYRTFGVKRMHALLSRLRVAASRSEVRRCYAELGFLGKAPRRKARTTDSSHAGPFYPNLVKGLRIERPDQVWVADATYIRVGSRFAYLALAMDAFTREILGWSLQFALGLGLALAALDMALARGRHPEIHHSDRDCGYAARAYAARLEPFGTRMSMSRAGEPEENGYAERLNRTVKEEEVRLSEYETLDEARESISAFVGYYNGMRIHSSLGWLTPSEAFEEWMRERKEL